MCCRRDGFTLALATQQRAAHALFSAGPGWRQYLATTLLPCMQATAKTPFTSRAWHEFPWARALMLEPWLKITLTFIGINGELWAGQPHFRCSSQGTTHFLGSDVHECKGQGSSRPAGRSHV